MKSGLVYLHYLSLSMYAMWPSDMLLQWGDTAPSLNDTARLFIIYLSVYVVMQCGVVGLL